METIKRLHEAAKSMTFMVNNISSPQPSSSSRSSNTSSISSIFSVKTEESLTSQKIEQSVQPASITGEVMYSEDSDSTTKPLMHHHSRLVSYGSACFRNTCANKSYCALCASIVIEAAVLTDIADSLHEMVANIQSSHQIISPTERNVLQKQMVDYSLMIIEVKCTIPLILIETYSNELLNISNVLNEVDLRFYSTRKLKSSGENIFHSLKEIVCTTVPKGVTFDDNYCTTCIHTPALYYPIAHKRSSQLSKDNDKSIQMLTMQFLSSLSPTIFHVPSLPPSSAADLSNYSLGIEVLLSGIRRVNGIYTATYLDCKNSEAPLHDKQTARIIFRKGMDGASIERCCTPVSLDLNIFVWAIIDGDGHLLYIACTESAAVIPPLLGWHSTCRGKLPPPTLKLSSCTLLCDTGTVEAVENTISPAIRDFPHMECSHPRPLKVSDFSSAVDLSYHNVTDSKVRCNGARADYSHIGCRRTRAVKAQTEVVINGPYREYLKVSKAIHTAIPMNIACGESEADAASDGERRFGMNSNVLKSDLSVVRNRLAQEIEDTKTRIKLKGDSEVDSYLAFHQDKPGVDNSIEAPDLNNAENDSFEQSWSLDSLMDAYQRRDQSPKSGSSLLGMVKEMAKIGLASASAAYSQATDLLPGGDSKGATSGKVCLPTDGAERKDTSSLSKDCEDDDRLNQPHIQSSYPIATQNVTKGDDNNETVIRVDDCFSADSKSLEQAILEERKETQAMLEDICEVTLPQGLLKNRFKCRVSLLGFELDCVDATAARQKNESNPGKHRLNYVLRIWLSNKRNTLNSKPSQFSDLSLPVDQVEGLLAGADSEIKNVITETSDSGNSSPSAGNLGLGLVKSYSSVLLSRSQECMGLESWSVITIRRTFSSLLAFHNDLIDILNSLSESFQKSDGGQDGSTPELTDIYPPPFVDAFLFGSAEEDIKQALLHRNREPLGGLFNGTSNINAAGAGGTATIYALYNEPSMAGMVLERTKSIDELVNGLQIYLEGVFSLVEEFDDTLCEWLRTIQSDTGAAFSVAQQHAIHRLGRLMGRFLRASDSNMNDEFSPKTFDFIWNESIHYRRPFWYNYVYTTKRIKKSSTRLTQMDESSPSSSIGVIQLSINLTGEKSGASDSRSMSSKSEIEQLRTQRSRCLGCGESLYTLGNGLFGSFGIGSTYKNFAPCRYLGGLFCRRWCHRDDRRMIPYRMLQFWDAKLHRVSRPAALFLDRVKAQPILNIQQLNPLLFEGVPMLRNCYRLRVQITHLIDAICGVRKARNRPLPGTAAKLRIAIARSFGSLSRGHLCVTAELYSLEDLIQIQTGRLMPTLETVLLALFPLLDGE